MRKTKAALAIVVTAEEAMAGAESVFCSLRRIYHVAGHMVRSACCYLSSSCSRTVLQLRVDQKKRSLRKM
jgi:hypothetical protein